MKIYDEKEIRSNYEKLTLSLIEKKLTITTMESCTSGQIASLITDTPGASEIMKGAFITYSNEAKIKFGVPAKIIDEYSVYSEQTACAMAKAAKEAFNADISIGVTGTMGNIDPANEDTSVPGRVYFAICFREEIKSFSIELPLMKNRLSYKLAAAGEIYERLAQLL